MHSIPGDPLSYMARNLPEQTRENYYATYGLDKPVYEQFAIFMKNLVTEGSFGESLRYPGRSITDTILQILRCPSYQAGLPWCLADHRCDPWNYRSLKEE